MMRTYIWATVKLLVLIFINKRFVNLTLVLAVEKIMVYKSFHLSSLHRASKYAVNLISSSSLWAIGILFVKAYIGLMDFNY